MSGVVLRCPNCGTTQNAQGQCEACHEASVRYFCLNHVPGVWLESVACPQCGARFGDPEVRREEPVPVPLERSRPRRSDERTRSIPPDYDERPAGPWDIEEFSELERRSDRPARADPLRILLSAMAAAARARSARAEHADYEDVGPPRRRGAGCFARLFLLIILLVAFMILAPLILGAVMGFG